MQGGWQKRIAKVLETFCAEAAVLLLIFPVLDEFVQRGRSGVSFKLVAASFGGSAFFLFVAFFIAIFVKEED